jgi:hypothetical protein
MRTAFTILAACLILAAGILGVAAQTIIFRQALDAIGNAEPPKSEKAQFPPDAGLDRFDPEQELPSRRGKVIVESGTSASPGAGLGRRKILEIER